MRGLLLGRLSLGVARYCTAAAVVSGPWHRNPCNTRSFFDAVFYQVRRAPHTLPGRLAQVSAQ